MDNKLAVKLIAPAKVGGKREPVGKTVFVTPLVATQLADAGAIPPVSAADEAVAALNAENANFDAAVTEKAKSLVAAAVFDATAELTEERDDSIRRAEAAEARITYLERQLSELKRTNTQPVEGVQGVATDDGLAPPVAEAGTAPVIEEPTAKKALAKKTAPKKPSPKKNATGG